MFVITKILEKLKVRKLWVGWTNSGSEYVAEFDGNVLINGTLTAPDLSGSVGPQGPQGEQGLSGATGAVGPQGAVGPPGDPPTLSIFSTTTLSGGEATVSIQDLGYYEYGLSFGIPSGATGAQGPSGLTPSVTGLVPYTGATSGVNIGTYSLSGGGLLLTKDGVKLSASVPSSGTALNIINNTADSTNNHAAKILFSAYTEDNHKDEWVMYGATINTTNAQWGVYQTHDGGTPTNIFAIDRYGNFLTPIKNGLWGIGESIQTGLQLANSADATSETDQYSPSVLKYGAGWKTAGGGANNDMSILDVVAPEQGVTYPIGVNKWLFKTDGTVPTSGNELMRLEWGDRLGVDFNKLGLSGYHFNVNATTADFSGANITTTGTITAANLPSGGVSTSGLVPYTGALSGVNIGLNTLTAGNLILGNGLTGYAQRITFDGGILGADAYIEWHEDGGPGGNSALTIAGEYTYILGTLVPAGAVAFTGDVETYGPFIAWDTASFNMNLQHYGSSLGFYLTNNSTDAVEQPAYIAPATSGTIVDQFNSLLQAMKDLGLVNPTAP